MHVDAGQARSQRPEAPVPWLHAAGGRLALPAAALRQGLRCTAACLSIQQPHAHDSRARRTAVCAVRRTTSARLGTHQKQSTSAQKEGSCSDLNDVSVRAWP